MNQRKLDNPGHKTIVCVPVTSVGPTLWDSAKNRPRIQSHDGISPGKYRELSHDSLVNCEHIYTINREFFTDYRFTLDEKDLEEIRIRMINIIGYGKN